VNFIAAYLVSISLVATDDSTSATSKCIDSCSKEENSTLYEVVNACWHLKKSKTVINHRDNEGTDNSVRDATATAEEADAANNCCCHTRENDCLSGRTINALKTASVEEARNNGKN
jgi:hypothetical protein